MYKAFAVRTPAGIIGSSLHDFSESKGVRPGNHPE